MEVISVAFIVNDNNEILALKRSDLKKSKPGKWHVLSGKVESGENPLECVIREIKEELGIDFLTELVSEFTYIDTQEDGQWETHLFLLKYIKGTVLLNVENSAYQWVSKKELLEMDIIPSVIEDLKHIVI